MREENELPERRHGAALVSVVLPAFNEADNLPRLYERLCAVLENDGSEFELVFVDDGSTDRTLAVLKELRSHDPRVHYLSLSRNFGHQASLMAGLEHCRGDVVISMDADLQHPPDLIPRMLGLWLQGYDVVHTVKNSDESASFIRTATARLFYKTFALLSDIKLAFGQSDFRLLDVSVVRELCAIPEHEKFLRGLVSWMGYRQTSLGYDVAPRFRGKATYSLARRLSFHVNGILSFSTVPLRLISVFGLLVSVPTGLYGLYALSAGLYGYLAGYPNWLIPGWASVVTVVTFLGGLQLVGIGIVGEYLGRIFEQSKGRPAYLIRESSRRAGAAARSAAAAEVRRGGQDRWGEADLHSPAARLF